MEKKRIALFEIYLIVFSLIAFSYFLSEQIPLVSAADSGCCELTTSGDVCSYVTEEECETGYSFAEGSACSQTEYCQRGCCYDADAGVYSKSVLEKDCDETWVDDPYCNLAGATKGCCVLGTDTVYETKGQCQTDSIVYAGSEDSTVDWRSSLSEFDCALLSYTFTNETGACVLSKGDCEITNYESCSKLGGEFNGGYLCTSEELNTTCEPIENTSCVSGLDGVYFLDSCGNVANIYDSSKADDQSYWEMIISVDESCGADAEDGNSDSESCGNCNRFYGGICGDADDFDVDMGEYYCKETSCEFEGQTYKNGESWCIYESKIGEGDDTVGSRHWKYVCSMGEVQVEPCSDYRGEVCIETDTLGPGNITEYRMAECVQNDWRECIDLSLAVLGSEKGSMTKKEAAEKCERSEYCSIETVKMDSFKFDLCVPKYPGGFNLLDLTEDEIDVSNEMCGLATKTCTVYYVKDYDNDWNCELNCECETEEYTQKMNELCTSVGDCGGYVNYVGEYSQGYKIRNAPKLSNSIIQRYQERINPVVGLYATLESLSAGSSRNATARAIGAKSESVGSTSWDEGSRILELPVGGILAALGTIALGTIVGLAGLSFAVMATAGVIGAIVAVGSVIYSEVIGVGDVKKVYVKFTCEPWSPPAGSENCELCNGNPLQPCSEYRCESLGAGCEFINEGSDNELCVAAEDDGVYPSVSVDENYEYSSETYTDVSSEGFTIWSEGGECIDAYTYVLFNLQTDEPSVCRYDLEMKEFEDMDYDTGSSYTRNHTIGFVAPDPSHGESQGLNVTGDITLYIKCQDRFGHETPDFYTVESCVKEGDDDTAPVIQLIYPESETLLGYNTTAQNVTLWTNEFGTCRWDVEDLEYSEMENEMTCPESISEVSSLGYVCTATLSVNSTEEDYYFRCMDQPWLDGTDNESERNANAESLEYSLEVVDEKITIDSIEPKRDIEVGTEEATVELIIETSNGGETHTCSYSLSSPDSLIEMYGTGDSKKHTQQLSLSSGYKTVYVECYDETGDVANGTTEFEIIKDSSMPAISRIWQDGSNMEFITTESAECKYSTEKCTFDWDEGIDAGTGTDHTISVVKDSTYYIKCEDEFGNVPAGCSIEAKAL